MDPNGHSQSNNSNGEGTPSGGDPQNNAGGDGNNQDPKQTPPAPKGNEGGSGPDLKSLEGDALADVFDNPNLWEHPRFKRMAEKARKADELEQAQRKQEEENLEKNKQFEELASKRATELEEANKTIETMRTDQALTGKLIPEGVVDIEGALKLIDRSKIKIDDSGNVSGIDEAIQSLKTDKAYLFKEGTPSNNPSLGSPANNNAGQSGPAKFKRSQLRDPNFYKEHREEILKAQKAGLIEDDLS